MKDLGTSNYAKTRDKYLTNAEKFAGRGEFRKASELLWGAIAQEIKTVAARAGKRLGRHKDLKNFIKTLSKEVENPKLYKSFLFLETLHVNFYDEVIELSDFEVYAKEAYQFIKKLEEIASSINR
ncbi:MAG: PaREP1 family protein [Candidatus Syntropharchaeia archaeon]